MKMKIDVVKKGVYGNSICGSNFLKLLMDNNTPPLDLLVRESIQNSFDAIIKDKSFGKFYFEDGTFENKELANELELIGEVLLKKYGRSTQRFLAISDKNTTGLVGSPDRDENVGKPANLYKLVYSFLDSDKSDDFAGGSWGIGKSVYFRYGIGLCFYYSRVKENNCFYELLTGAIIEDENDNEKALLSFEKKSTGIAFLGQEAVTKDGKRSIPVRDQKTIHDFLSIFGLEPYSNEETGTRIIIPYFDFKSILLGRKFDGHITWEDDFGEALRMSVSRWYFPKLNNEYLFERNKKYFYVSYNSKQLNLNPFFQTLQELCNAKVYNQGSKIINHSLFNEPIGRFVFKLFEKSELSMTPPNNLLSLYAYLDIPFDGENETNQSIIAYFRNPGMIITYSDTSLASINTSQDKYLIGFFVLNDKASYKGELVGKYFKAVESSNHKLWDDLNSHKDFPYITGLRKKNKPFSYIKQEIKKILKDNFEPKEIEENVTVNTVLQRRLAEILLPPENFGKNREPSIIRRKKKEPNPALSGMSRASNVKVIENDYIDGKPSYTIQFLIRPGQQYIFKLLINTAGSKYSFEDWDEYDFVIPFYLSLIETNGYMQGNMEFKDVSKIYNNRPISLVKKDGNGNVKFKVLPLVSKKSQKIYGFKAINRMDVDLKMTCNIVIEPVDFTYSYTIRSNITEAPRGESNNEE